MSALKTFKSLILIAGTLLLGEGSLTHAQTAEDYQVYDAVIGAMFRDGITQFDMNAKVEQLVIRNKTFSEYKLSSRSEDRRDLMLRLPALNEETIADYAAVRTTEVELGKAFDFPFRYSLITDKELSDIVTNESHNSNEQWTAFYKRYPRSAGYNSFSRVGYDKDRRNAVVYFVNWCGPLCGTGTLLALEKTRDRWMVKGSFRIWIS